MLSSSTASIVKYVVPVVIALGATDSLLKEMLWVRTATKQVAFFALGPLVALGTLALLPYMRSRITIVTPRLTSNLVLVVTAVVSVFQALV